MASLKRWLDQLRHPWKAEALKAYTQFRKDKAIDRLFDFSDLPPDATVLDFGGFRGEWTDRILAACPDCTVHVFEPHPDFARQIAEKFAGNSRVHVHDAALAHEDGVLRLSDAGDASSAVAAHEHSFEARTISASRFFAEAGLTKVGLAKMNIEGGEYELLPALIEAGLIDRIDRLQIQFHLFSPDLKAQRDEIRSHLELTHRCDWNYPFVWEEWRLKPSSGH
ncbi:FkbM family methyltransferase [Lutimaribacter marinistellae]|uniref:FkbM family methyltransferase n=1 Tax=Lutimaribacter marinistellae TaxID=1820329 RepID=A0ABV7TLU1_9RHOB